MRQPPAEGPRAVECTAMMHFNPLAASWKAWTASCPSKAGESNKVMGDVGPAQARPRGLRPKQESDKRGGRG